MATLTGKQINETYKDLLQVSNSNSGVDTTARSVEDGEGTASALSISTVGVGIGTTSVSDASTSGTLVVKNTSVTTPCLLLESEVDSAATAPDLRFYKNDTPANADLLFEIVSEGKTADGTRHSYAGIWAQVDDNSDGAQSGRLALRHRDGGANKDTLVLADNGVGIGLPNAYTTAVSNRLYISNPSSGFAQAVVKIEQLDVDDTFIDFVGTSAGDSSGSVSSSTGTGSTKVGAIKIDVNGAEKWIRIYDTAV